MINTSDEYNKQIYKSGRKFIAKAKITLSDGTVLNVGDADIMQGGLTIEDGVSSPNSFEIGGVVIGELTLVLNNLDDRFSSYDFYDGLIFVQVGVTFVDGTTEWIPKGYFTIDEATYESSTINITALNNMHKFDKPYSKSTLSYPATLAEILRDACFRCSVPLSTQTFLNSDYVVTERPVDDKITFREVVSWTAQLAGCFARINSNGELVLDWYDYNRFNFGDYLDGGNFIDYESGDDADGGDFINYGNADQYFGGIFAFVLPPVYVSRAKLCDLSTDDITITGVQIIPTNEELKSYVSGEEGYVISIEDNPLAQNGIEALTYSLGEKLNGFTFRPFQASSISNPAAEAGDVVFIKDRKGNKFKSIVSNLSFTVGDFETFSGDAETPNRKNSSRYSIAAKAIQAAKKETEKQISNYDLAVQQLSNLMANAMGIFETVEKQDDGAVICYAHDKPTLAESQTIWKKTRDAFAVSVDGGTTWHGLTADGNIVAKVLTVIGINADWINAGSVKAENISQEYKSIVTKEINDSVDEVTQAFKAADGQLLSTVNATLKNYSTTTQMNSAISQSASSITSTVSQTYLSKTSASDTYATKTSLTQTANEINSEVSKKVNNSEFGTKITQNYSSVQIAWNNISQIIQFSGGELNIYDSSSSATKQLLMKLNYTGEHFYNKGVYVGKVGTNYWSSDNSKKGLVFDLSGGHYMCWADNGGSGNYITKLAYYNTASLNPIGLHLGAPLYLNGNYVYIGDNIRLQRWSDGSGIGNVGDHNTPFSVVGNDNYRIFSCDTGGANFHKNLYMHNYSIYDTSIQNSSDIRLKKDIANSKVEALNMINAIECKEFRWKEDDRFEELGFIAQQVGHVNKKFIGEQEQGAETYYTLDQLSMIPYLVKSIQELSQKIDIMQKEIASLKGTTKAKASSIRIKTAFSENDTFDLSDVRKTPTPCYCEPVKPQETGFKDLGNGEVEFFKR